MEAIAEDDRAQDGVGAMSSTYLLNKEVRTHTQPTQKQEDGATQQQQQSQQQGAAVKMTKVAKEAALGKLVADGWLKHGSRGGEYALGVRRGLVRTFLELGHQLLELPDLPEDTKAAWQDLM
ncbi:hypothetical protein MNEG_4859 [Monoraphidium neglectum]|uniref:Non-structural maintenance of chromosomes element 1 homolog n=1 Tax=Monoraphidium neglectum TaxID=145388 RepID=A0A0D2MRN4_9CHLO|nr:hypothetical protein MNEG_4859 [Monoraphidium neglectum]KIZ03097.1 hypothetical protein MNEG_4859 [Monoraphidium neglectum]|eukprot:XP_013902116.1 hypothetical protein MNEG_4859 [Monoraphidium neglectum]